MDRQKSIDPGAQRTIQEVAQLHRLEPTLKTVYVEGLCDKLLLKTYFSRFPTSNVVICTIDRIIIKYEQFIKLGLEDNNRSRVIFLARSLREGSSTLNSTVACLIDADYDYILSSVWSEELLIVTDFTSVEMLAWNEIVVEKLLLLVLKTEKVKAKSVLGQLGPALTRFCLLNCAIHLLELGIKPLPISNSFTYKGPESVIFDDCDYLNRLLNKGAKMADWDRVVRKFDELRAKLPSDIRLVIRGHDFINTLQWYLSQLLRVIRRMDPDVFWGIVMSCVDLTALEDTRMFTEVRQRLLQVQQ